MTNPLLLELCDATKVLGVGERLFLQYVRAGEIKYVIVGRTRKYPYKELERFVQRNLETWPPTNQKTHPTGTMISGSEVIDIRDLVKQEALRKQKSSRPGGAQK